MACPAPGGCQRFHNRGIKMLGGVGYRSRCSQVKHLA